MGRGVVTVICIGIIIVASFEYGPVDKVVFMDVGQGDAILLQDGTRQVLIDGGRGMAVLQRLAEEMPWFDRKIEVVVVTHPQQDHMEGLMHVLERYEVGMVLLPYASHTSQLQEAWLQKIIDKNVPYRFTWTGQHLTVGDMDFQVLGPIDSPAAQAAVKADLNNASLVMRVDYCPEGTTPRSPTRPVGGIGEVGSCLSLLLTGDAEARAERLMLESIRKELLDVDVLKIGHHGSKSSTTAALLAATTPAAAVISVGADNRFGHPSEIVLQRLSEIPIWRTDEDGSIKFIHTRDQWLISSLQ